MNHSSRPIHCHSSFPNAIEQFQRQFREMRFQAQIFQPPSFAAAPPRKRHSTALPALPSLQRPFHAASSPSGVLSLSCQASYASLPGVTFCRFTVSAWPASHGDSLRSYAPVKGVARVEVAPHAFRIASIIPICVARSVAAANWARRVARAGLVSSLKRNTGRMM